MLGVLLAASLGAASAAKAAEDFSAYLRAAEPQFALLQTMTTTTTSTTTSTSGGGGRVQRRTVLTSGGDGYGAVNLAHDRDRDEYLAAWVEDEGSSYGVYARIFDADGTPLTPAKEVSKGSVDCCQRIGLAWAGKDYLVSYTEEDGDLVVRRIKAGKGKGRGKATVIAAPGFDSAVGFDPEGNNFLVSYSDDGPASFLQKVNTKAKPVGSALALDAASGSNDYAVRQVAFNLADATVLTVGVEIRGSQSRPVGLGFDPSLASSNGPFVYDNQFKNDAISWVAAAFRDDGAGLVAWNRAQGNDGDGFIRAIGSDGSPSGSDRKVGSGQPVNLFPLAEDLDQRYLIVWTDLDDLEVMAQEASDTASLIGSSFEISDSSERVESGFNAAAYNSISGESAVIYSRAGSSPAVVVALLSPP